MKMSNTIAAISTPPGEGGIAIVRLSGSESLSTAVALFSRRKGRAFNPIPWRVYLGEVSDSKGEVIDECLCTYFKAPKSFTGEDSIEFSIHGGSFVSGRILERVLETGVRLAEPGEFTKRAFLNGRLKLSQAEAVIDVIRSTSDRALKQATQHLRGDLESVVQQGRDILGDVLARIEVSMDFPEHDIPEVTQEQVFQSLERAEKALLELIGTVRAGRVARDGLRVALIGRPNAGKSSLLNSLAGQERAIVTDVAGTTRDTIEVSLNLSGVLVTLIDTAGVREGKDLVEKLGVARTEQVLEDADIILILIDGSGELHEDDRALLERTAGRKRFILATKADLPQALDLSPYGAIPISVVLGQGTVELKQRLAREASQEVGPEHSVLVTNIRHAEALQLAQKHVGAAKDACSQGWEMEIVAIDTKRALELLGEISGDTISEDVTDSIFTRFCIGK